MLLFKFDPVDMQQMKLVIGLTPAERVRLMLEAREFAVAILRTRLRKIYPELSERDLNLKLIAEYSRAERNIPRF
jgi:hypothetical protein